MGLESFPDIATLTGDPSVQSLVPEWAAPNLNDVNGIIFYGVFMLSAVLLAISPRRPAFWELAVFVVFGLLSLQTTRGVIWFGIVIAPVLAVHFSELGNSLQRSMGNEIQRKGSPFVNWLFVGLILLIAIISLPWFKEYLPFPRNKAGLISAETPREATRFLLENNLDSDLFNEIGFGSVLDLGCLSRLPGFC